jgi:hypothetical protein
MRLFREIAPARTYTNIHSNYHLYKPYLAKDFNYKCGYTDCSDFWFGGKNNFHIDHFIPWKKHIKDKPYLKTDYSNLVYCCSYVNVLKSDDEGTYLDPCDKDYNQHFQRENNGKIIPLTDSAKYMYKKLKLYLERYRIIWMLDQLDHKINILESIGNALYDEDIKKSHYLMLMEYRKYCTYLSKIDE